MEEKTITFDLSADKLLDMAEGKLDEGEFLGALRLLHKSLDLYGPGADEYADIAEAYEGMELYERAAHAWFCFLDICAEEERVDAYEGLITCYYNLGNAPMAMHYYGADEKSEVAKELKNVAGGDIDLASEDEKKEAEEVTKENEDLFGAMKDALGGSVTKVVVSSRLTDTPACITAEGPVSLEMEKIMSRNPEGGDEVKSQRVLEINAKSPVFEVLKQAQADGDADKVRLYTNLLYDQALLIEGIQLDDPVAFAQNIVKLMA